MQNIHDENSSNKENRLPNDDNSKFLNDINHENTDLPQQKIPSEKDTYDKKEKSYSSIKLKITEHYEIKSKENLQEKNNKNAEDNQFENNKNNFINDFYSEESDKSTPKIIDGKIAIDINEIIGEESKQPILIEMIDDDGIPLSPGKISAKSFGVITSYAANTNQGIVRDYNEDRVSVIINMNKPKYYTSSTPWPKISYFGVFDGHAGNQCAEFLRDNLLIYICNNNYFPNDIPNAIKYGFKKIDEDYLKRYAFVNNKLLDNSGSCGLILLIINNLIYIANVGDSRCLGSFKNGKIQKDITLDHKPNTPYEKERIIKNGGKIYQTQTPIEDDEAYKDKILVGPYRVFPGKLSVSRTVGDAEGKIEALGGNPNVIVPQPDIFCFNLDKDDIDFFILGCDGIYDQLYSKDVFKCAWLVLNNNLELYKKRIFEKNIENSFRGNYGNDINMNTTSGNIVDLILKASMLRKSFDNVTCLFISFKNFFESFEKTINEDIKETINKKNMNPDILIRNKSNISNNQNNKIEPVDFKEKNHSDKTLTKESNNNEMNLNPKISNNKNEEEDKNKNSINNIKKINTLNQRKIRISSLPKQPMPNINRSKYGPDNIANISNNQNNNKNITDNNILTYNKNIILNADNNSKNRANSFNDKIILKSNRNNNDMNSHIIKDNKVSNNNNNNNNNLISSSNQVFFTKMHITGLNNKNKNKKTLKNNERIFKNNLINHEDKFRHTSYNKKIVPLFPDSSNDIGINADNSKKEKNFLGVNNNNINKKINYKKINEAEYIHNYGNSDSHLVKNNIRSNSNTNSNTDKFNIKPIVLKTSDKFHQGNNYNYYQNNLNIKFNNIIKTNSYGIVINKINGLNNITDNNIVSLKNITLTKLKKPQRTDEIKLKKRMPTLTSHMHVNKNNNFNEDNTLGKQRRFITNDNVKRKTNLSEHKKLGNGSYKVELNLSIKNNTGIENKLNNLYNNNREINNKQNETKSIKLIQQLERKN